MKYGRLPRAHDPRVPHLSAYLAGKPTVATPTVIDWTKGMVADLGMMLNDTYGDCAEAAVYHARQTWTLNAAGIETTESDAMVERLYALITGFDPNNQASDQGTVLQQLLAYWLNAGAPIGDGSTTEKLIAWFEVDPRNFNDVFRTIAECGGAYVGMWVPSDVTMAIANGNPVPSIWTGSPDPTAGHCVWVPAYNRTIDQLTIESWGSKYAISRGAWAECVEECYALFDPSWIAATGKTPFGMTRAEALAAMAALRP